MVAIAPIYDFDFRPKAPTGEAGEEMLKRIERLVPHGAILICNMYVVFFLIDRVNPAMNFIDNGLTKGLLVILCALALYDAWRLVKPVLARRGTALARSSRPAAGVHRPATGSYAPRQGAPRPSATRSSQPQRGGAASDRTPSARPASAQVRPAARRASYDSRDGYRARSSYRGEGERR